MEDKLKDHHGILNKAEEIPLEMFGYRTHLCRRVLCVAGYLLSCGILLLVFYWKPEWNVWANCAPCSLEEADVILLRTMDDFKKYFRKKVLWVYIPAANIPDRSNMADENSVIYRAIMKPDLKIRYIVVQKIKYVWIASEKKFQKTGVLEDSLSCSEIHAKFASGLTRDDQDTRRRICGPNTIEVEIAPIWKILIKEVLNLFYLFQFFTVSLWISENYLEYSLVIMFMSFISIALTLLELRKQSIKLHKLVDAHNNILVTVCGRNGDFEETESRYLVPGDVLVLMGRRLYLPCDAILIQGSCVVNEGMLTGESIPVTKTPLPREDSSMPWKKHSVEDSRRHILFCGTEVIQTKPSAQGPVKAVVMQTGFNTAKGDLVKSILYPKPMNFKLHRDAFRFFMFLAVLSVAGTIYAVYVYAMAGISVGRVVKEALLLMTGAIPPAIPAALTTGNVYAQRRLKKKSIFCISPDRINICGQINLICFDKTGTLTEDGLDLWGIIPSQGNCLQKVHNFSSGNALPRGPLLGAMASCHSLIALDGNLQGDPLDLKMFEATNWGMEDSTVDNNNDETLSATSSIIIKPGPKANMESVQGISILHQFPFSSALQRMTVITRVIGEDELTVYMKGAPEMVVGFCKPETVPPNFSRELEHYTFQGFRVIGLAYKTLETKDHSGLDSLIREEVESNLIFLGLLILENRLKAETKPVIQELNNAHIRTVMITGDSLQTAITVAKNSGMVSENSKVIVVEARGPEGTNLASIAWQALEDNGTNGYGIHASTACVGLNEGESHCADETRDYHFAMSGKSLDVIVEHFSNLLPKLLLNGTIFARMSPAQKSSLIEEFQKLDYYVGMCGSGANDCGALKTAHAGISLSEQEASVASPFTSKTPNIECVSHLIKEGRAALVTSLCVFKFMALYGMIEYIAILLLYWQHNIFGNYQFLVHDLAIIFSVFLTMSLSNAYPKLAPYTPPAQLSSPPLLLSVILHICISLAMQMYGFLVVQRQSWYDANDVHRACLTMNESILGNMLSLNASFDTNVTANETLQLVAIMHKSFENTTLWLLVTNNLITVAFVFSKGKPFRQPIYTNYPFLLVLIVSLGFSIFFIFADMKNVYLDMELVCTPTLWRVHIVIILIVHFSVSFLVEETIIENRALWMQLKKIFRCQEKSQYKRLRNTLDKDPEWPPFNKVDYNLPTTGQPDGSFEGHQNPAFDGLDEVFTEDSWKKDVQILDQRERDYITYL
ncbi:probable cation-transporting ATPase 13A4 [Rhinatrema bivittatum]|uniref:probable cation-transporting ATPase 13A4 n=1 Tax=Rhinatrema bivittatum TaxID=194408 RepID=UPI00112EA10D|nr:probable cation-transporting ATPase 13A4 [Rhinatrema bivittatum]